MNHSHPDLVLLGDIHIADWTAPPLRQSLARFIHARGREVAAGTPVTIVFTGDFLDFPMVLGVPGELPGQTISKSERKYGLGTEQAKSVHKLLRILAHCHEVTAALRGFLHAGGQIVLLAGNHDMEMHWPGVQKAFREALGGTTANVRFRPWFHREGDLHAQHGHQFDGDNAADHPLYPYLPDGERLKLPMGILFTRYLIRNIGSYELRGESEKTPLGAIVEAFRRRGLGVFNLFFGYLLATILVIDKAGRSTALHMTPKELRALEGDYAALTGADREEVHLLAQLSVPSIINFKTRVWERFYLGRIWGGLAAAGLFSAALAGLLPLFHGMAASVCMGGLVFAGSVWKGNRIKGVVKETQRQAAARIREITGATTVVMGHIHKPVEEAGFFNTDSFGDGAREGRPYLRAIWRDGHYLVSRQWHPYEAGEAPLRGAAQGDGAGSEVPAVFVPVMTASRAPNAPTDENPVITTGEGRPPPG